MKQALSKFGSFKNPLIFVATVIAVGAGFYLFSEGGSDPQSLTLQPASDNPWRGIESTATLSQPVSHQDWVTYLAISSDNQLLASGDEHQTIKLWDLKQGKLLRNLKKHEGSVTAIDFSVDGKRLASSSTDKTVNLWNIETAELLHTFSNFKGTVTFVAFVLGDTKLVTVSTEPRDDQTEPRTAKNGNHLTKLITLWDAKTYKQLRSIPAGIGMPSAVAFDPNKSLLAIGNAEFNTIELWNLETGKLTHTVMVEAPKASFVSLSRASNALAGSDEYSSIWLWKLAYDKPWKLLRRLGFKDSLKIKEPPSNLSVNVGRVDALAFDPKGDTLFTGDRDKKIQVWNVVNGELLRILKGHTAWVSAATVSPDGKMLVTGSTLGEIKTWQYKTSGVSIPKTEVTQSVRKLLSARQCQQCDLGGADLRNYPLSNVNLQWANLGNANLQGADLRGANLSNAILFGANLKGANLEGANVEGANLDKAIVDPSTLQMLKTTGDREIENSRQK